MKINLQSKLVLYNAFSKALIITALAFVIPLLIEKIVYNHLDKRLKARHEKMIRMINIGGLNEIALDQDCSFDSQNIFKEEFVSISPLPLMPDDFGTIRIDDTERTIDTDPVKHRVLSQAFIYDNQLYQLEIGEGLSSAEALKSSIRSFTLKVMLAVVLFSILVDLGFARVLLKPFNLIVNRKLRNVTHPTAFDTSPVQTNTAEFSRLDASINEMMTRIQEEFRLEREFITNVSHELLTPISILQNRVENMINDPALPEDAVNKLAESQKMLARLARIIKALLQISKIENDQYKRTESASIPMILQDVLEEADVLIQDRNIHLEKNDIEPFLFTPCNPVLLHTLFFNLLSNAIKYNRPEGSITVSGKNVESGYVLRVTDTGIGIPKDQLPYIFDRFKRLGPEDEKGYGLGLPIVRSIAAFHDIRIEVNSTEGEGTTFLLFFPESAA